MYAEKVHDVTDPATRETSQCLEAYLASTQQVKMMVSPLDGSVADIQMKADRRWTTRAFHEEVAIVLGIDHSDFRLLRYLTLTHPLLLFIDTVLHLGTRRLGRRSS